MVWFGFCKLGPGGGGEELRRAHVDQLGVRSRDQLGVRNRD